MYICDQCGVEEDATKGFYNLFSKDGNCLVFCSQKCREEWEKENPPREKQNV